MNVFVTGASGYIGGSIAKRLMDAGHRLRGLTRSPDRAQRLQTLGIDPVVGSLDDMDLLGREARKTDAVVNAADSDHAGAVDALIEALAGSERPLLHTSGTSVVADDAQGEPSDKIYDEDTPFEPVPEKRARARIDARVRAAAARGVRAVVLCNALIYGHGLGAHRDSVQIPALMEVARQTGVARFVGRGLNTWSNAHVEDVAELYCMALDRAPAGAFYYVENGEASFKDMANAIAARLGLGGALGWSIEEAIRSLGDQRARFSIGSNSRVRAKRARAELGWKPRHDSVLDWIRADLAKPDRTVR